MFSKHARAIDSRNNGMYFSNNISIVVRKFLDNFLKASLLKPKRGTCYYFKTKYSILKNILLKGITPIFKEQACKSKHENKYSRQVTILQ